jgi:hypothetical protein
MIGSCDPSSFPQTNYFLSPYPMRLLTMVTTEKNYTSQAIPSTEARLFFSQKPDKKKSHSKNISRNSGLSKRRRDP